MSKEDEMLVEIGKLKGQLIERERSRDELKGLLDAMQDDLDLMRERAVRAETRWNDLQPMLKAMEKI